MNDLQVIENKNQRVLLTSQLAESYGTTEKRISENFNANKDRYQEGKHYFSLEGNEKREFLNHTEITDGSKKAKTLFLWTEKGAMLHAKSLSTDKAWEMYETLVDTYFEVQAKKPLTQLEILAMQTNVLLEMDKRVNAIEQKADKATSKLNNALDIFANPVADTWKTNTNAILNQICLTNGLNYQTFKHDLYVELENSASCDLAARQRNLRARLKKGGATSKEYQAITKIDVIERDEKLKLIFDGIVKRYQAKYLK